MIIEKISSGRLSTNFTVVISAKAGGKENFAFVHFLPKFTNEHAPIFVFDRYDFAFSQSRLLGRVKAYDPDPQEFGRIVYSIVSGKHFILCRTNTYPKSF